MFRSHRRICVAAALLPLFLTFEVAAAPVPDPTRADATVKAQPYESVFKNYQPASDETTSPDKLWRGANDAVAGQGGHSGMAGMSMDGPMKMPMPGGGEKSMPADMKMPMNHDMKMPMDHGMKKPMDHNMKMQDGHAIPMDKSMPSQKAAPPAGTMSPAGHEGMQMPGAKAKAMDMKMPMDHTMPMPAGHAMPMDQAMPMPKKVLKVAPAAAEPMPPGMDLHEGHKGK